MDVTVASSKLALRSKILHVITLVLFGAGGIEQLQAIITFGHECAAMTKSMPAICASSLHGVAHNVAPTSAVEAHLVQSPTQIARFVLNVAALPSNAATLAVMRGTAKF
jgi:hypothetical protein